MRWYLAFAAALAVHSFPRLVAEPALRQTVDADLRPRHVYRSNDKYRADAGLATRATMLGGEGSGGGPVAEDAAAASAAAAAATAGALGGHTKGAADMAMSSSEEGRRRRGAG